MKFSRKTQWIIVIIATIITIVGLVTGWYMFFLVFLPLGFLFGKKEDDNH
ncbi:hypothetical protein [Croceibacter atlanticus]|nr:hypothetical protein [Croceibacter atlanticus]MBW4970166.1 hypothetical protein [Croceibacter atlanticus]WSP35274.1 hypothetical protein VVL01_04190 [Croceibacter atlanticus]